MSYVLYIYIFLRSGSLALNYSAFQYEVLGNADEACKMARTAFEDAIVFIIIIIQLLTQIPPPCFVQGSGVKGPRQGAGVRAPGARGQWARGQGARGPGSQGPGDQGARGPAGQGPRGPGGQRARGPGGQRARGPGGQGARGPGPYPFWLKPFWIEPLACPSQVPTYLDIVEANG